MNKDKQIQSECESVGLPAGSKHCDICMGKVFGPEKTDRFRAIWGLPPLFGESQEVETFAVDLGKKKETAAPKRQATQPTTRPARQSRPPQPQPQKKGGCRSCGKGPRVIARQEIKAEPNGYGPGSQLLKLWQDMPHCDACEELAGEMDRWGVAGCRRRFDAIVADILPRAREWMADNRPFFHKVLATIRTEDATLLAAISYYVKRAIGNAEQLYQPIEESTTLAAVVPFYNYMRADSRLRNYHQTAAYLRARGFAVYVAEAVLEGDEFQIPQTDRVSRFTVRDPLFIKESLFNAILHELPEQYTAVAWLDADFIFDRPDIVDATIEALRKWPVVQTFKTLQWLDTNGKPERGRQSDYSGAGYRAAMKPSNAFGRWPGGAWAARRDVLDEIGGLYDGYPAGSCDVLALAGFLGQDKGRLRRYSSATVNHFMPWYKRAHDVVRGRIGYVEAVASHLFHGVLKNRQYTKRHDVLKRKNFDPVRHLQRNADGINQLSADCPQEIRESLSAYMLKLRREP